MNLSNTHGQSVQLEIRDSIAFVTFVRSRSGVHDRWAIRALDADEALAWGIVNEVVEGAELEAVVRTLASRLAAGPVGAYGALKRLMAESEPGLEAQMGRESRSIAACGASAEGREGITAFLEKRSPRYR